MKKEKILTELESVAEKLDIKVRHEKGDFAGGYCTKDEENLILLNKRHMIDRKINVLARELAKCDLAGMEISKPVLGIIESERKRASQIELEEISDSED
ncbi:MAG: hypothetical protein KDC45_09705 [Bacteroidetes bacterium]|nr:hypothetical protein [Bacteroidota bacterium]